MPSTQAPASSRWLPSRWIVHCEEQQPTTTMTAASIEQKLWRSLALSLCIGLPMVYIVRKRFLGQRFPTAAHIPPETLERQPFIRGKVVAVGDSDNFRLYHTPGWFWWMRHVPTKTKDLRKQTISIRLAGVDAPEGAHFGMPAQPLAAESKAFLTSMVLHRNVKVQLLSRDRYGRIVGMAHVRTPPFYRLKNVSVEMCKVGLATLYTAKGAEYGNLRQALEKAEARAKLLNKGVWGLKNYVSPGTHKAKYLRNE